MLNRYLNFPPCLRRFRSSIGPFQAPKTSKTASDVAQNRSRRFITRTTAWCKLQSKFPAPIAVEFPRRQSPLEVEPMTDTTGPSPSSQSRALDLGNDESGEEDAYLQARPESSSPGSLSGHLPSSLSLIPTPVRLFGLVPRVADCQIIRQTVSGDGKHVLRRSCANPKTIHWRWVKIAPRQRIREWEDLLFLALKHSPECALEALDVAVLSDEMLQFPKYSVDECLAYLTRINLQVVKNPPSMIIDKVHRILCNLAKRCTLEDGQTSFIPQHLLNWVVRHCHSLQALSLYQVLREENIRITPIILLSFSAKFLEMGKIPLSLEVLRNLPAPVMSTNSEDQSTVAYLVRVLIRFKDEKSDGKNLYSIRKQIVAQILRMGIQLDITAYTALLENAIEAQDYESAVQFYEMARGNGLKPDRVMYIFLLEAAMQHPDYRALELAVRDVEADRTLYGDEGLIFKLLCAKLKLKETTMEPFLFDAMLLTYERYCDLSSFHHLGLCEPTTNPPDFPLHARISPSRRILGFMLVLYIKQHRDSEELFNTYQRYYRSVDERHPLTAAIEETDHVANAFIFAFGRRKPTLQISINIVRKMLENSAYSENTDLTSSMGFKFTAPTVQTWSILAMVYARHGQAKAADKILTMMLERGLKPNHTTWNSLVSGYSDLQRIEGAVATVKRMEADGLPMDGFTLKGLGRFRDRDRLLQVLREGLEIDDVEVEQDLDERANADEAWKSEQSQREESRC